MFSQLFKKQEAQIMVSKDYVEELRKQVELLTDRVKKLELKHQLTSTGELKIYEPVRKNKKTKRFLSQDDKQRLQTEYALGMKCVSLAKKYDIHYTTARNIINEMK